jgi:hypothetical protein
MLHLNDAQVLAVQVFDISVRASAILFGIQIRTEIVVWKLCKGVRRHDTSTESGAGKKESPTENGKFGADRRLPAPKSNQGKSVDIVLEKQDQKAKEKARREQG